MNDDTTARRERALANKSGPRVVDVEHSILWRHPDHYAGHPNRGGIWNLGGGEIAVAHLNAYRPYRRVEDTWHNYVYSAKVVLQRSFDGGRTWPKEHERVICDRGLPLEQRRAWLFGNPADRADIDMTQPRAIFHFEQEQRLGDEQSAGDGGTPQPRGLSFALRSADGGVTWEDRPTLIPPPAHRDQVIVANFPMVRFPNDVLALAGAAQGGALPGQEVCLYTSDNHGLSWEYVQTIAYDPRGIDGYTYPSLLRLETGRLLCVMLRRNSPFTNLGNWPCVRFSDDDGMGWTPPRAITRPSQSPWPAHRRKGQFEHPPAWRPGEPLARGHTCEFQRPMYRSPFPVLLRDGRILVILARRKAPAGISLVVSKDGGTSWLPEVVLRADASVEGDVGYPVATQLDDGRIFTAYYYCNEPDLPFGGPRYIAGTHFRLA